MKSIPNPDAASQNSNASSQASGNGYAPSVPISVYRELAAELQANRVMLDSLHAKNQQLAQQNQRLRQELQRVVQFALNMQQLLDTTQPIDPVSPAAPASRERPAPEATAEAARLAAKLRAAESSLLSDELIIEEDSRIPLVLSDKPRSLGGLWMALVVIAIIVTAFGAGFLVVRPLLPSK